MKMKRKSVMMKAEATVLVCNLNEWFQSLPTLWALKMALWWIQSSRTNETTNLRKSSQIAGGLVSGVASSDTTTAPMVWWRDSGNECQTPVDRAINRENATVHVYKRRKKRWSEKCSPDLGRHVDEEICGRFVAAGDDGFTAEISDLCWGAKRKTTQPPGVLSNFWKWCSIGSCFEVVKLYPLFNKQIWGQSKGLVMIGVFIFCSTKGYILTALKNR